MPPTLVPIKAGTIAMISWGCTSFSLISFALLFKTRLLARNLPPRIREKDPICFAICPMAGSFHSISDSSDDLDELYGNSFGSCISFSLISKSSSGLVGNHRVIKPSGHETKPATIEMPQSRPLIRLTLKAAPPTKIGMSIGLLTFLSIQEGCVEMAPGS